jgi:hypothetical protein
MARNQTVYNFEGIPSLAHADFEEKKKGLAVFHELLLITALFLTINKCILKLLYC